MTLLILALGFLLIGTEAAHAGPVGAAIAAIGTAIKGSAVLGALFKTALSIGLSKLAQKLLGKKPRPPGQQVEGLTDGELTGESFIVGRFATGGNLVWHGSHGSANKTPNVFYTRVIELAGVPRHALRSVILKGEFVTFDGVSSSEGPLNDTLLDVNANWGEGFGRPATNESLRHKNNPHFWLKFLDGSQTEADPWLVETYGSGTHPFTADMIGAGICYAIATYRFRSEVWQGGIEARFVLDGIPLYDPRFDSSIGGAGPQRWNDPDTWLRSFNPMVIAYNAARGITLPGGDVYGGGYGFADLPLARWVAAMNHCDAEGYEFGAMVDVANMEPADLIEACFEACAGQVAPVAGDLIPQVGPPDVAVWSISDDDASAEDGVQFDPIKGLADRHNAVQASYIAPAQFWEPRNLPLVLDATAEAEDGRRLIADLRMAGVYKASQAQALSEIYVKDGRRQRVHTMTLAPHAARLSLFDTVALTRPQDGYQSKLVEVVGFQQRTDDTFCVVTLREVDPADYAPPSFIVPEPPTPAPFPVVVQEVPGFAVTGVAIVDNDDVARRAGVQIVWDFEQFEDVTTVALEIRRLGGSTEVAIQVPAESGGHVEVLLPDTQYEARAQLIADRSTDWTSWRPFSTPDVRLSREDMDNDLREEFEAARDLIDGTIEDIGGVIGDLRERIGEIIAPIVGPGLPGEPHIARLDQAIIDEAHARADALQQLADELTAEAEARASDALALAGSIRDVRDRIQRTANDLLDLAAFEHLERETIRTSLTLQVEGARAEYTQQITVLAGEQTAIAQQVVTLEAATETLGAAITLVDTARVDGQDALAAQIALLSVGSAVQFDHVAIWYWDTTVEGWTGSPDAPAVTADGWLAPASGSFIISPDGLQISAQSYRQVRALLRNEPGAWADAWFYWAREGQDWSNSRRIAMPALDWADNQAQLTINPDWSGTIDRVRLDLPAGVEIDWLAIGRPAPGASSADIAIERAARIGADEALASSIATLSAELVGLEGDLTVFAGAVEGITVRVEQTEEGLVAVTEAQTAIVAQIEDIEGEVIQQGAAVDNLTVIVEELEGGGSRAQSESVRAVRATQRLQGNSVLEGFAANFLADQAALEIVAQASQALNSRIDLTDQQVAIVSQAVTALQAVIPGLATASAVQALTTQVTLTQAELEALSQAVTAIDATIPGLATASALQGLETRVTATEGVNSTQSSQITVLQSALTDAEDDISANAGAITSLTATVTQQGEEIESVSSQVTALDNRVTTAEENITAQGGALQSLTSRVTVNEDEISSQSQAITDLQSGLENAESGVSANAGAISGLTTTVTQQGDQISAISDDVTELQADLSAAEDDISANATALTGLTARVTTAEDGIVSLSGDLTQLDNSLSNLDDTVSANSSAIGSLQTTVSQQGDTITAQGQSITDLQTDLSNAESGIGGNTSAINVLVGQVQDIDGEIEAIAASTRILEASTRAANLVPNGAFSTGDLAGWSSVPITFSVIARGSNADAAVQNAPQPFVLQINSDSVNRTSTATGEIPCQPGDSFIAALSLARQGTGTAQVDVTLQFLDAAGGVVANNFLLTTSSASTWARTTHPPVIAPAGSASVSIRLRRRSGGPVRAYVADLRVERQTLAQAEANARIDTIEVVKVDAAGAVAAVNQEISAEYGDLSALASATAFAEATADGIREGFIWRTGAGGAIELVSVEDGTDGPTTVARIRGDYILLDGNVQVTEAFQVGGEGTGERAVTTKDGLRVYDANNVARVIIGKLD